MQKELTKQHNDILDTVAPDLIRLKIVFVNIYMLGEPAGDSPWILIDAGLGGYSNRIKRIAEKRFGRKPAAIVLTHGHFDHVGSLKRLVQEWDVPVYAHRLEIPYLTGKSSYPPPDPLVGGGVMALMSWAFPKKPITLGGRVEVLPENGRLPFMSEWKVIHTPGHAPGHVSFYRERDGVLIAGDAFVTVKQESVFAVMTQKPELTGPPSYFTTDWHAARRSVEYLVSLRPEIVATGHGKPMGGQKMQAKLQELADKFDKLAVPSRGRYISEPAVADEDGVVSIPPPVVQSSQVLLGIGLTVLAGATLIALLRKKEV